MSFANCLHVDGANTHYKDGDEGSNEGSPNEWWLSRAKQTHTHNRLTAFVRVNPGRPVPEETLTHSLPTWSSDILSSSSIYNDQWHPLWVLYFSKWMIVLAAVKHVKWHSVHFTCLTVLSYNLSPGPLVFLLVLHSQLHTPYISSPNHHHLFAAHAHTNVACSAAKPMLCHLYLVSLSAPYLGISLLA